AGVGQGVGCFVQEGGEDVACGAAQSFAADHDLGELLACDVPAVGGVVAPAGVLAVGAAGDDDHDWGDFGVPAADFEPDVFQDFQDRAGYRGAFAASGAVSARAVTGAGVSAPRAVRA